MRTIVFCCLIAAAIPTVRPAGAAEMRTWSAASGGFTIEAELVELRAGDVVRLKTKDGRVIDVALAQLSAADRAFARPAPAAVAIPVLQIPPPQNPSPELTRALRSADRQRRPDEALIGLKVFCDDPKSAPAETAYVAGRIEELKAAAAKKLVRLNKQWVAAEEAAAVRDKADGLMREGIELFKLKREEAFLAKFREAAALEPDESRSDFIAALIYTKAREGAKALPLFQKCLARDPENHAILNNAALLAAATGDFNTASAHWRKTLESAPDQRIVHNVGRFLEQCTKANVKVPKLARDLLALPYAELVASGKFQGASEELGWLLLLLETSDLDIGLEGNKDAPPPSSAPPVTEDGPVIGGGTGFVVHPGHLLTNAHVAKDDCTFEIQTPDGRRHKATRVAASADSDLALLRCEGVTAPPLVLRPALVPRGTDVMLLGYPEMQLLGASLKATRGSISSLPDPQGSSPSRQGTSSTVNSLYLYDAVSNAGNSGGPLCDDCGNVLAVHSTGYNTASRYAGGIPSTVALEFVKGAIADFQPAAASEGRLSWPKVDEKAAPSTLLIWVRKRGAKAETASVGADTIEIPFCIFCGGWGGMRCGALGCKNGFALARITRRDSDGCASCFEKGVVPCEACGGKGIDLSPDALRRLARNGKRVTAGMARPPDIGVRAASFPAVARGKAIDLLPLPNVKQYSPIAWERKAGAIECIGENFSRFVIPYQPPREYDLIVTTLCPAYAGDMYVGLKTPAGKIANAIVSHGKAGFAWAIPGKQDLNSFPRDDPKGENPHTCRFMVREAGIFVTFDDRPIVALRGDSPALAHAFSGALIPGDANRLFIGSKGGGSSWSITNLTLILLE